MNYSKDIIQIQNQLRKSIDHFLTFDDSEKCLEYISTCPKYDPIILITTEKLSNLILPQLNEFSQVISVYIYLKDHNFADIQREFLRTKVSLDNLVSQIHIDQNQRIYLKLDQTLSISIDNFDLSNEGLTSTRLNGQYLYFQLLIECLVQMEMSSDAKQEVVRFCKEYYKSNNVTLQVLDEFEKNYSSDQALHWYTRDSFAYQLLNKALRIENIDLLYLFRFFLRDIEIQLKQNQYSSIITVYRGQLMSKEEIEILNYSIEQCLSINTFFSTSTNRNLALFYLTDCSYSPNFERVLFEISADPQSDNLQPFADISSFSQFSNEEEILFMVGSIFKLENIQQNQNGIWIIRLRSCSSSDTKLQLLFEYMKDELNCDRADLFKFGLILGNMAKYDSAQKYIKHYLNQLPENHRHVLNCHRALGYVLFIKGDYDSSLKLYNQCLQMVMQTFESNHLNYAYAYIDLASVYQKKHDYNRAIELYEKGLRILKARYGDDHIDLVLPLNKIGSVFLLKRNSSKAFEYQQKALTISQKYLPEDHSYLSDLHNSIATICRCRGEYKQAFRHLNISLQIVSRSRPSKHPSLAHIYRNIGLVHMLRANFVLAEFFLDEAAQIYRRSLPPTHRYVIESETNLKLIRSKWKWFSFIFFSGTTFASPLPYFSRRTSYIVYFVLIIFMFICYSILIEE